MGERTLFPNASTERRWPTAGGRCGPTAPRSPELRGHRAGHAGQRRRRPADLRRPAGADRRHWATPAGPVASFGPLIIAYARRPCRGHRVRPHRRLAQLGRDAALLRPRHHQRLRPPDRAQPRLAHRPAVGRGHRHARDVELGLRRADRRHGVGHPAHQRHDPRRHRGPRASSPGRWRWSWRPRGACSSLVLHRRMGRVVAAEKDFSDAHSRATGVIADTIANLTTVRSQAAEDREKGHVGALVGDSMSADLRARRVFTTTRLQMESAMAFFNWAAVAVGVVLALHHVAAAGRGLPDPVLRHLRRHEPGGVLRVHTADVARHRPVRQVRRHRRHRARHRRRPGRARPAWCRGAASSSATCASPTAPARRSSRGWTCASSPGSTSGWSGPRARARRR